MVVRRGALFIVVLALIVSTSLRMMPVRADDGPITVKDETTESLFRQSLTFKITAKSTAGKINSARLFLRSRAFGSNVASRPDKFEPAAEVTLTYQQKTANMTTPPWQTFTYQWEITDDAGNTFRTQETKGEYEDKTRDWQKLSDGKVAVYWYGRDDAYGQQLLDSAHKGFDHISRATGFAPDEELRVVAYNTQDDFCSFQAPRDCLSWVGGLAFGSVVVGWMDEDWAVQRAIEKDPTCNADCQQTARDKELSWFMESLVPHELSHAFLNYWLGPRIRVIPRWFNEGQAVNNELTGVDKELARVREIAQTGTLERLRLMDAQATITRNKYDAVTDWYATATSLVAFLYEKWGLESLGKIVSLINDQKNFEAALKEVTGLSVDEYELAWRNWLGVTTIPATFVPSPVFTFPATPTPVK